MFFPKWATHFGYSQKGDLILMGGVPSWDGERFIMAGSECHCLAFGLQGAVPPMSAEESKNSIKPLPESSIDDGWQTEELTERIKELEQELRYERGEDDDDE